MRNIFVLDGTLRDGGYVNHFLFGADNIKKIINGLENVHIDIIECGFLKSVSYDINRSLYDKIERLQNGFIHKKEHIQYVVMIKYADYTVKDIINCSKAVIDGIRLAFHEHEIDPALIFAEQIAQKGYKVFLQPVSTLTYSQKSLERLIEGANRLIPYAFYIVDTLGCVLPENISHYFDIFDKKLQSQIMIGFHSHNNLRLSFQNACELCKIESKRDIILDSAILGMGRGAGNLDTMSLLQHLNTNYNGRYNLEELAKVTQQCITPLSSAYKWGYDPAYEISAYKKCHPNYASYLIAKQSFSIDDIEHILETIDPNKKILYDKRYIERLCLEYCQDNEVKK